MSQQAPVTIGLPARPTSSFRSCLPKWYSSPTGAMLVSHRLPNTEGVLLKVPFSRYRLTTARSPYVGQAQNPQSYSRTQFESKRHHSFVLPFVSLLLSSAPKMASPLSQANALPSSMILEICEEPANPGHLLHWFKQASL